MTKEEREKLADFFNENYAHFLAEEDKVKRACYRGKVMGVDFVLDALGYTVKGDGVEVRFFPDSGKSIECVRHKVVKKPRKRNRERKKIED